MFTLIVDIEIYRQYWDTPQGEIDAHPGPSGGSKGNIQRMPIDGQEAPARRLVLGMKQGATGRVHKTPSIGVYNLLIKF